MKINFTKKEYRQLLDLVFLGDWVVSSFDMDGAKSPYVDIQQKIYSYAKELGCEELIEHVRAGNQYFETAQFESEVMHHLDAYDEHVLNRDD